MINIFKKKNYTSDVEENNDKNINAIRNAFLTEVDKLTEFAKNANVIRTDKQHIIDKSTRLQTKGFCVSKEIVESELETKRLKRLEEEKRQAVKDNYILDYVKSKVSDGAYKEILKELKKCWCTYHFEIVKTPDGKMREHNEFCFIEGVYVNQTINGGYSGDDYDGTCAIKISDNEYFQFYYSM